MQHNKPSEQAAERLAWRFRQFGLAPPPLPRHLGLRLQEYDDWLFATFEPSGPPYWIERYLDEVAQAWPDDQLLVSHDGHGVNSWAIHYIAIVGSVACFLQIPWGGAYMNEALPRETVNRKLGLAGELLNLPIPSGERVIVLDGFRHQAWSPVATDGQRYSWQETIEPLEAALDA
ncbi:MAG: hypothetical protein AAF637_25295, partial [Pseudomonadota bacterium]